MRFYKTSNKDDYCLWVFSDKGSRVILKENGKFNMTEDADERVVCLMATEITDDEADFYIDDMMQFFQE